MLLISDRAQAPERITHRTENACQFLGWPPLRQFLGWSPTTITRRTQYAVRMPALGIVARIPTVPARRVVWAGLVAPKLTTPMKRAAVRTIHARRGLST